VGTQALDVSAQPEPGPSDATVFDTAPEGTVLELPKVVVQELEPPPPAAGKVNPWVEGLVTPYLDYRRTWHLLYAQLNLSLGDLPESQRGPALDALAARFPALEQEEEFQKLRASLAVPRTAVTPTPALLPRSEAGGATSVVAAFAQSYAPASQALATPAQVEQFMGRLAQVLEAFGNAYLALRKGKEQFEQEMGVASGDAKGVLQRTRNVGEVLRYLLELGKGSADRVEQLTRSFADVMIHQVALLNGIREGARGLVANLLREMPRRGVSARFDLLDWLLPYRARWRRLEERQRLLLDEDSALTSVLFGNEFARSYASVASEAIEPSSSEAGVKQ
jgi:hypothetical protein